MYIIVDDDEAGEPDPAQVKPKTNKNKFARRSSVSAERYKLHLSVFNIVIPGTRNELLLSVFKVVIPGTRNELLLSVFKVVIPGTRNELYLSVFKVVIPGSRNELHLSVFKIVIPYTRNNPTLYVFNVLIPWAPLFVIPGTTRRLTRLPRTDRKWFTPRAPSRERACLRPWRESCSSSLWMTRSLAGSWTPCLNGASRPTRWSYGRGMTAITSMLSIEVTALCIDVHCTDKYPQHCTMRHGPISLLLSGKFHIVCLQWLQSHHQSSRVLALSLMQYYWHSNNSSSWIGFSQRRSRNM